MLDSIVIHEWAYTEGVHHWLDGDDSVFYFVNDCVARLKRGDYGVVGEDVETSNREAIANGIGTVYGSYGTWFATGDGFNQVRVAQRYDVDDSGRPEIQMPVCYLPLEH